MLSDGLLCDCRNHVLHHIANNTQLHFMTSVKRVAQRVIKGSKLGAQAFTAIGYKLLKVRH